MSFLYDNEKYNKRLNNNEDDIFYAYINFMNEINLLIREKSLIITTNIILRNYYFNSSFISKIWSSRWLSRYYKYDKKFRKSLIIIWKIYIILKILKNDLKS